MCHVQEFHILLFSIQQLLTNHNNVFYVKEHSREENVKLILHAQITRVSMFHSYLCFEGSIFINFPDEWSKCKQQLEYTNKAYLFFKYVYIKLNAFVLFFLIYICFSLSWIDISDVILVTFMIEISRNHIIRVGAADW